MQSFAAQTMLEAKINGIASTETLQRQTKLNHKKIHIHTIGKTQILFSLLSTTETQKVIEKEQKAHLHYAIFGMCLHSSLPAVKSPSQHKYESIESISGTRIRQEKPYIEQWRTIEKESEMIPNIEDVFIHSINIHNNIIMTTTN